MFYYNKKSMIKSQLLQIDYDRKSGIYFRWNFHDIYDPSHYFRHFIIINSKDVQKTKQFINHYVNRVVAGDFFKIIYGTNGKAVRNLKFRQKMPKQFFDAKRYLKDFNLGLVQIDSLMQKFQQEQLQFSEACVIAIFVDEQSLQKNIIERITNKREQGLYKFLTFIYGPFKYTSLSINSGIHSISHKLQNKPIGHMISYQMNMVYQAAIWKASLQITLNNGELLIQNQKKWRQLQQNRIQRQYYGPSIKYLYDILELYCFEFLTGTYDMLIKFQYKTFSSNVYKSQKRIIINYDYKEQLMKSMDFSHHANLFDDGSMRLQENPFSSISKVKYLKPITTKYQQDEEPKQ